MNRLLALLLVAAAGCDNLVEFPLPQDGGPADRPATDGPAADLVLDLATDPDLAASPDLATSPDLAGSPDLAASPDLALASDLAASADLTLPADLSASPDQASRPDLAAAQDLARAVDQAAAPDLVAHPDLAGPRCGALLISQPGGAAVSQSDLLADSFAGSFTVEAWILPTQVPAGRATIAARLVDAGKVVFALYLDGGQASFSVGKLQGGTVTGGAVKAMAWSHVAGEYDAPTKSVRLYVDGKAVGSQAGVDPPARQMGVNLALGGGVPNGVGGLGSLSGYLDDFRLSTVARYQGGAAPAPNLALDGDTQALYRFDEAMGTVTVDASPKKGSADLVQSTFGSPPCRR